MSITKQNYSKKLEKYYYSYIEFRNDTQTLVNSCKEFKPEVILGIARGGLTLAHFMGQSLNIRNVFTINSIHYNDCTKLDSFDIFNIPDLSDAKKVLIVDDIVDSGETMREILKLLNQKFPEIEFKIATLFYKPNALIIPDYKVKIANTWINFFWETDIN